MVKYQIVALANVGSNPISRALSEKMTLGLLSRRWKVLDKVRCNIGQAREGEKQALWYIMGIRQVGKARDFDSRISQVQVLHPQPKGKPLDRKLNLLSL